ncbi:hypothetical protein JTE90_024406 [Oedothorax gibbosus]|uniref:Uncharacterized protein n=1 Tax=Oedothorax gibbosus TaxID=931172 RepID=A0AAV6TW24_9ARAC|nr:hypothetical protein JTE90_024406 [Oedothorax gibbosus]
MFKSTVKADLYNVCIELQIETVTESLSVFELKNLIENSEAYKTDQNFVRDLIETVVSERKEERNREQALELERVKLTENGSSEVAETGQMSLENSGSDVNLVNNDLYVKLGSPKLFEAQVTLASFVGDKISPRGYFEADIMIDNIVINSRIYVVDALSSDLIIGLDVLNQLEYSVVRDMRGRLCLVGWPCQSRTAEASGMAATHVPICACASGEAVEEGERKMSLEQ